MLSTQALEKKFRAASREDRKLVESLLDHPTSLKASLTEAFLEILNASTSMRGQLLSSVLDAAVLATQGTLTHSIHSLSSLDALVDVLTQPEALAHFAPDDPLAIATKASPSLQASSRPL